MASNDAMEPCLTTLASKQIKDDIILSGNKAVEMFASSAIDSVDVLSKIKKATRDHIMTKKLPKVVQ
ncbi:hypothetical protein ACS0TY_013921 [Phlomoides rotata]